MESIASCHSITYVNGELIGDPLDVKMFESTKWILDEPSNEPMIDELVLAYVRPPTTTTDTKDKKEDIALASYSS